MVDKYNLRGVFRTYGYEMNGHDFHLIKEMIYGPLVRSDDIEEREYKRADAYTAIQPNRQFLYEIVANKANQIDVDKWDYFARDSYHLGVSSNFLHDRFIKFARVLQVPQKGERMKEICYRDKKREPATPPVSKSTKIKCPPSTSEKRASFEEGGLSETKRAKLQEDEHI
ncbi:deoxynucleoside triphosphate triphosphohydrolase SAMHD1-like [Ptychodera flava]|uniref:deoxynucleoside triphosphate triphosphohydrolase SAMHD1-like n=1 Tax=Ptychodera flava TaxID=63121 RepID=UPI00396A131E